jgi:GTP cyclohydrolase I
MDDTKIIEGVKLILEGLGINVNDENFKDTPKRYLDFLKELTTPKITDDDYVTFTSIGNLVIARNIRAYSLCPHHLLPVIYNVNLAYIPKGRVVGVSKLARVVMDEARKLSLQEDFTENIANSMIKLTESGDVMVVIEGKHLCMIMRGVKQDNSSIITSAIRGEFNNSDLRSETLNLMKVSRSHGSLEY